MPVNSSICVLRLTVSLYGYHLHNCALERYGKLPPYVQICARETHFLWQDKAKQQQQQQIMDLNTT